MLYKGCKHSIADSRTAPGDNEDLLRSGIFESDHVEDEKTGHSVSVKMPLPGKKEHFFETNRHSHYSRENKIALCY